MVPLLDIRASLLTIVNGAFAGVDAGERGAERGTTGCVAGLMRGHGVGRRKEGEGRSGGGREVYIVILKYRDFVVTQKCDHLGTKPLAQPQDKQDTTPP